MGGNNDKMGADYHISTIDSATLTIDDLVDNSIEDNSFKHLAEVKKHTEKIRENTKEIKTKTEILSKKNENLEKKVEENEKLIWVDLAYKFAPLAIGLFFLIWGKLTKDPRDTIAGVLAFFVGSAMTALHHLMSDWGILVITALGLVYWYQKKDIDKKQKPV